jgi:hypothetical protein
LQLSWPADWFLGVAVINMPIIFVHNTSAGFLLDRAEQGGYTGLIGPTIFSTGLKIIEN